MYFAATVISLLLLDRVGGGANVLHFHFLEGQTSGGHKPGGAKFGGAIVQGGKCPGFVTFRWGLVSRRENDSERDVNFLA